MLICIHRKNWLMVTILCEGGGAGPFPLHWAIEKELHQVVEAMLANNPDAETVDDKHTCTPLQLAVQR